jgi:midasin (ATPase involved in ribosome maturation)
MTVDQVADMSSEEKMSVLTAILSKTTTTVLLTKKTFGTVLLAKEGTLLVISLGCTKVLIIAFLAVFVQRLIKHILSGEKGLDMEKVRIAMM